MPVFTDQMQQSISLGHIPQRIVSLVPSQTELLYYLGLDEEVVGQTLFCIHPEEQHRSKPRVGGTKKLQLDKIRALQPDLIIGNKEENEESQIKALQKEYPVWMSDIQNLEQALDMISRLGEMLGRRERALQLCSDIQQTFEQLALAARQQASRTDHSFSVLYLIWRGPWMGAGPATFISDMLKHCGWENALSAENEQRYPELDAGRIAALDPDLILLSSEPYPFKEQHLAELKMISPGSGIRLVDGEMFSWYGSRLLQAPAYFSQLLL